MGVTGLEFPSKCPSYLVKVVGVGGIIKFLNIGYKKGVGLYNKSLTQTNFFSFDLYELVYQNMPSMITVLS